MAVENRGGYRPTAPQNNPTRINPFGGNGQSGMNTDYTGFAYGQNKAVNEQRQAAPIKTEPMTGMQAREMQLIQQPIIPLDAPETDMNKPITSGAELGAGPGREVLNLPQGVGTGFQVDSGIQAIRAMYVRDPRNQDLRRILELVDQQSGEM